MATVCFHVARQEGQPDPEAHHAQQALAAAGLAHLQEVLFSRVYLLESTRPDPEGLASAASRILADPIVEEITTAAPDRAGFRCLEIARRPGVMDPVEHSTRRAFELVGHPLHRVRTARRYHLRLGSPAPDDQAILDAARRSLANDVVEEATLDPPPPALPPEPDPWDGETETWPVRDLEDQALLELSAHRILSLDLAEMHAVQQHYRDLGREPTDVELETIAQTWSEHCKHKTLTGRIRFRDQVIDNLLASTIKAVTRELARPWCWSVFEDNAGVVDLDGEHGIAFKVETHNHPSALEPYGGAGTGIGGVIRDIMGTGLGARPFASTDVFCVGPPDLPADQVPRGALHPRRVLEGVVSGVRDYGNRMGIPTVNGALYFDPRYTANPLVFCGTLGLLRRDQIHKEARPGDWVVVAGGATGRDGIHGATFSSVELTSTSETTSSGAVQIGNPIEEKRLLEAQMTARDRGLYCAVTDCGAGGFSSAVGEMGAHCGADVDVSLAPLKYRGLRPAEIWISEAQERMVFAVPPEHLEAFLEVFAREEVTATPLGRFTGTGRLVIRHGETVVGDLSMEFLHDGCPQRQLTAEWSPPPQPASPPPPVQDCGATLLALLARPVIASKEWVIRQYDHEVQGGTVGKPLVGARHDGPADAAVLLPVPGSRRGVVVACGAAPGTGDLDPRAMGALGVEEAVRNAVAVGAAADRIAILDNYSWGNCTRPDRLGSLVLATQGACEAARALGTPFISGKDSLNNEFDTGNGTIVVPPTLLISALGVLPDIRRMVTMDLKRPGASLYVVGSTTDALGGSELYHLLDHPGGSVPSLDLERSARTIRAVAQATERGLVATLHDASEGGLAVALAEMCIGGQRGAWMDLEAVPVQGSPDRIARLFAETPSRFLAEVEDESRAAFEQLLARERVPWARVGETRTEPLLELRGVVELPVDSLRAAWKRGLDLGCPGFGGESAPPADRPGGAA